MSIADGGTAPLASRFLNGGLATASVGLEHNCFARPPQANFDSFGNAFLTTFQIFTGEDWSMPMFQAMRSVGTPTLLYFCVSLLLGRRVHLIQHSVT